MPRINLKALVNRDFYHEVKMLLAAYDSDHLFSSLFIHSPFDSDNVSRGIRLEVILLHMRNLWEFYYDDRPRHHALAQNYMKTGISWRNICGCPSKKMVKAYKRICAQVTHLSYNRTIRAAPPEKLYEYAFNDLLKKTKLFLEHIANRYNQGKISQLKNYFSNIVSR